MIIALICIFLVLVVICIQLHRGVRVLLELVPYLKYHKYSTQATPDGYTDTSVQDVRKTLDNKIAQDVATRTEPEEQFESYTEGLGEDIIISDK